MTKIDCSLSPNCGLSNEGKKDKNYTRLIECHICLKTWHAYCIGYHSLKESELSEKANTFVCNKCNFFVNAVSDVVAEKVYSKINDLFARFEIKLSNVESTLSEQMRNNINNITTQATINKDPPTTNKETNKKVDSEDIHESILTHSDDHSIQLTNNDTIETKTKHKDALTDGCLYLCSIEKCLSISDISLILEDASIYLTNIDLLELEGNFKKKKYIKISCKQNVNLFKFKLSFEKSNLNGTWFLRSTPPRSPLEKNLTIDYSKTSYNEKPSRSKNNNIHKRETHQEPHRTNNNWNKNNNRANIKPDYYTRKDMSYANVVSNRTPESQHHHYQSPNSHISQTDFQHFLEKVLQTVLYK